MNDNALRSEIADVFDRYPAPVRTALLALRRMILAVAGDREEIGGISETLKWGQASYAPLRPRTGTPVRIDADATHGGDVALYVNCQTDLVETWRDIYPGLMFGGSRSVHFRADRPLPEAEIRHLIAQAFTYHRRSATKKKGPRKPGPSSGRTVSDSSV